MRERNDEDVKAFWEWYNESGLIDPDVAYESWFACFDFIKGE